MTRVLDLRIVVDRDDRVRASIDGRAVALPAGTSDPSAALVAIGRMIDGAAWSSARGELAEVSDPSSPIYAERRS